MTCAGAGAVIVDNFVARYYTNADGVLPYRLFIPTNYTPANQYPIVLFLHGGGDGGTDNRSQLVRQKGPLVFASETNQLVHPSFMVAPQCPNSGDWTDAIRPAQVFELMNLLQSEFSIDPDRCYITGLSMGGYGTWDQITTHPDRYAAAIPMSSGGYEWLAPDIAHMSIWNFHATDDDLVPVTQSRTTINALRMAGGHPIYTEYTEGGHAIWTPAYNTSALMTWAYAQKRGTTSTNTPILKIATPTVEPVYAATNLAVVTFTGTASAGSASIIQVILTNTAYPLIRLGTGTTNWSVFTPLNGVATNLSVVIARGPSLASLNGGTTFSDTVAVIFPPPILTQPQNQTTNLGDTVTFNVTVGAVKVTTNYQWRFNGANLVGKTNSSLTLSNVQIAHAGLYSVQVSNIFGSTTSSSAALAVRAATGPCLEIANPDFEGGFTFAGTGDIASNWTAWEADAGVLIGFDEATITHGGAHAQRIRIWGGAGGTSGGVYERVPVTSGQPYVVNVWTYAGDNSTACFLGVDPAGGTDATAGVTWSPATTNSAWELKSWSGTATANYLTVFCKVSSSDSAQRNGYFDDAAPASPSGSLRLVPQRSGNVLVLSWPECPIAHLEQSNNLNEPVNWVTATNPVSIYGGRRSVTLMPSKSTGFFRLVVE